MRKWLIAILLCVTVAGTLVAYILSTWHPSSTQTPTLAPKVGIFYYVWYDNASEVSWDRSKIIDQPILGFYNSSDPVIIRQHLLWMKGLGIDFVVISWWGFYDDYGKFTDNAAKQVFETAQSINSTLKFAIMAEPFSRTGSSYDYNEIYNHIYENFVTPYPSLYYNDSLHYNISKPVICFFNNQSLTDNGSIPLDENKRFNTVLVGQQNYTQWTYTDLNVYDKPAHSPLNQTSVTPRYDDSRVRTPSCVVDLNLTQGTYDSEWQNAIQLWKDGKINTIMITSWNEYPERTAIEPHYDATAYNQDPYFLYNTTKDYINQFR